MSVEEKIRSNKPGGVFRFQHSGARGTRGGAQAPRDVYRGRRSPGLHHLVYEVVDNSIDEALAGYCSRIDVFVNEDNSITVKDDGRGIPTDMHEKEGRPALEVVLTVLHAGGKFNKDSYKVSGGLHGVGVSCVNALSTLLVAEVHRGGKIFRENFSKGVPQGTMEIIGETTEDDHGTIITFKPDSSIFTVTEYDYETLASRLRELAYLNKGIRLNITDLRTKNENGGVRSRRILFDRRVERICQVPRCQSRIADREYDLYRYRKRRRSGRGGNAVQYEFLRERAFVRQQYQYDRGRYAPDRFPPGADPDAEEIRRRFGYAGHLKFEINGDDFREGLTAIVSVKVQEPQFEGQTKTKLGNGEVAGVVDQAISGALTHYLEENPKDARAIVSKVILAATARHAARKARELVQRKTVLSGSGLPGKAADCASRDRDQAEIFLRRGRFRRRFGQTGPRPEFSGYHAVEG